MLDLDEQDHDDANLWRTLFRIARSWKIDIVERERCVSTLAYRCTAAMWPLRGEA